ncbi:MAG: hypothetical protein K8I01_10360 [Candidatus Methylomirabilis sp.]|nr:hypothetical protein [Deltaproteobacteria bacterium]
MRAGRYARERELDLADYWAVVWKRRLAVLLVSAGMTIGVLVYSFTIPDMYESRAVIMPAGRSAEQGAGVSAITQRFGSIPGITLPASASSAEITSLLKSNLLRARVLEERGLLQRLFTGDRGGKGVDGGPTTWDGLRALDSMLEVKSDLKDNTITLSATHTDPRIAADIAEHLVGALTDHMSAEAKRVALANKAYLEAKLGNSQDPIIRQKIYNLIAQQMETAMMSEMKESFAFKVVDPPRVPDMKSSPDRRRIVQTGFLLSLAAGVAAAFLLEFRSKRASGKPAADKS